MTSILSDKSFYADSFNVTIEDSVKLYCNLLNDYFISILEKKKIKNKLYFQFIFDRGIKTIHHVFIILFIYIKNLPVIVNECKKGYFYYIEFIEQIMDEDYNFLHLSSSEAVLFVYKKTIYEIDQSYRKTHNKLNSIEEIFIEELSNIMSKFDYSLYELMEQVLDSEDTMDIVKEKLHNNKISFLFVNEK